MGKFKKLLVTTSIAMFGVLGVSTVAHAHLVAFGWKDNGNGTVTLWGQHWHGDQSSAYSDNIGVHIGTAGSDPLLVAGVPTAWPVFPWLHVQNNIGGTTAGLDAMVASGILTGYAVDPAHFSNSAFENDWFKTDPLVIGNGTWSMMTGTNCCVDTMSGPLTFTLTGIISVPPGTPPGGVAPEPATMALLGLGGLAAAIRRRSQKRNA